MRPVSAICVLERCIEFLLWSVVSLTPSILRSIACWQTPSANKLWSEDKTFDVSYIHNNESLKYKQVVVNCLVTTSVVVTRISRIVKREIRWPLFDFLGVQNFLIMLWLHGQKCT